MVLVNGESLPDLGRDQEGVQFVYPEDYRGDETPAGLRQEGGWGVETLEGGREIRWRVQFYASPINNPELRGISIFAKGKLAQSPFTFNLTGGLGGQHGLEYMSGQVEADYIDSLPEDIIATERQRINWEHAETQKLEVWGQDRVKALLKLWQSRRQEQRVEQVQNRISDFLPRIEKLTSSERRTVKKAVEQVAQIETITDEQLTSLGEGILTAWEQGRLKGMIDEIGQAPEMTEDKLLSILLESQVLAALSTTEVIKTKIATIEGLEERIIAKELENAVRDYLAANPWLVSPEWETFSKEESLTHVIRAAANSSTIAEYVGRLDLVLSSGRHVLVMEFMRPGLTADWDHLSRYERYITEIRNNLNANSGGQFDRVSGVLVADQLVRNSSVNSKIQTLLQGDMAAMDWQTLLAQAKRQLRDYHHNVVKRTPVDGRIQDIQEPEEA